MCGLRAARLDQRPVFDSVAGKCVMESMKSSAYCGLPGGAFTLTVLALLGLWSRMRKTRARRISRICLRRPATYPSRAQRGSDVARSRHQDPAPYTEGLAWEPG
jgi:hypothetical protein